LGIRWPGLGGIGSAIFASFGTLLTGFTRC